MIARARPFPAASPQALVVVASVWMAVLGNLPLWQTLWALPELQGLSGLGLLLGMGGMIAGTLCALLALVCWRWSLKPVVTVLLLLCALASHYMWLYGIVVDTPMLINVLQTDAREASDQLGWSLVGSLLGLFVVPTWWLWRQPTRPAPLARQSARNALLLLAGVALALVSVLATFQSFSSLMRNHMLVRYQINPLNSLYAVLDLTVIPAEQPSGPLRTLGEDARIARAAPAQRPPLLVLVVGETARSQNFSLNGYARPTNPLLAQAGVVSFTDVRSCGTSTAESLPCMFSPLGRSEFKRQDAHSENLLDVLQRAGLAVLWIDNQSGCKGLCERVPNVRTASLKVPEHCRGGECFDTVMLQQLDGELAQLSAQRRARGTVVVLHQMGSHGPAYYKRTPPAFKPFQPECTQTSLSQCRRDEIVNAYDNTLVFTDHFLAQTLKWLQRQQAHATPALLYVSDHGESLGENNLYLHGLPYAVAPETQTRVPMVTWLSSGFEQWRGVRMACLQQSRSHALSHDHLFHSVLGLMGVATALYQPSLDLYAACERR